MAGIAKTPSDTEYAVTLVFCGAWSVLGVVAGIGRLMAASWAERLQDRLTVAILFVVLVGIVVSAYYMWTPLL
jgi:uncharacterized membrane protein YidH (DUF202 family)